MGDQDRKRKGKEKTLEYEEDPEKRARMLAELHGGGDGEGDRPARAPGALRIPGPADPGQNAQRSAPPVPNPPHRRPEGQLLAAAPGALRIPGPEIPEQNAPLPSAPVPNQPLGRPEVQLITVAPGGSTSLYDVDLQGLQRQAPTWGSLPLPPRPVECPICRKPLVDCACFHPGGPMHLQFLDDNQRSPPQPYSQRAMEWGRSLTMSTGSMRYQEDNPGQSAPPSAQRGRGRRRSRGRRQQAGVTTVGRTPGDGVASTSRQVAVGQQPQPQGMFANRPMGEQRVRGGEASSGGPSAFQSWRPGVTTGGSTPGGGVASTSRQVAVGQQPQPQAMFSNRPMGQQPVLGGEASSRGPSAFHRWRPGLQQPPQAPHQPQQQHHPHFPDRQPPRPVGVAGVPQLHHLAGVAGHPSGDPGGLQPAPQAHPDQPAVVSSGWGATGFYLPEPVPVPEDRRCPSCRAYPGWIAVDSPQHVCLCDICRFHGVVCRVCVPAQAADTRGGF